VLNILIRPIMFLSAAIAAFFVARDAPNFTIIQMVVGLLLIVALVAIGPFWETLSDRFGRKGNSREPL
jgi:MFS family permease